MEETAKQRILAYHKFGMPIKTILCSKEAKFLEYNTHEQVVHLVYQSLIK